MSAPPTSVISVAEYFAFERQQQAKHEFYDGEIFLQAGASMAHNLIAANIIGMLHIGAGYHTCICSVYGVACSSVREGRRA